MKITVLLFIFWMKKTKMRLGNTLENIVHIINQSVVSIQLFQPITSFHFVLLLKLSFLNQSLIGI